MILKFTVFVLLVHIHHNATHLEVASSHLHMSCKIDKCTMSKNSPSQWAGYDLIAESPKGTIKHHYISLTANDAKVNFSRNRKQYILLEGVVVQ